eukprot:TRINITY_DN1574_c0_g1_i1.p1 TRINITY_DN1574_c0_g1~~TRINITY_DN1574_c0_g1_i1.p1  ORF type:complete len:185 (+),score=34.29 TRINITY_DN1574_c0_g1_i1:121-675(+)
MPLKHLIQSDSHHWEPVQATQPSGRWHGASFFGYPIKQLAGQLSTAHSDFLDIPPRRKHMSTMFTTDESEGTSKGKTKKTEEADKAAEEGEDETRSDGDGHTEEKTKTKKATLVMEMITRMRKPMARKGRRQVFKKKKNTEKVRMQITRAGKHHCQQRSRKKLREFLKRWSPSRQSSKACMGES